MTRTLHILLCVLVAAMIACVVRGYFILDAIPVAAQHVGDEVDSALVDLDSQTAEMLEVVQGGIADLDHGALSRVDSVERDAFKRIDNLTGQVSRAIDTVNVAESDADSRLTDALNQTAAITKLTGTLQAKVNAVDIAGLNQAVKSAGEATTAVAADVAGVTAPIAETAQQINVALPDFLDCDAGSDGIGNPTCLYVRYADMTADADKVTGDIRRVADKMTAPCVALRRKGFSRAIAKVGCVAKASIGLGEAAGKAYASAQ